MTKRQIFYSFLVGARAHPLSIFFFDQPIAAFAQRAGGRESAFLQQGTHCWKSLPDFPPPIFLAWLMLGAGALLFIAKSTRPAAWMLLFIATAHLVTP